MLELYKTLSLDNYSGGSELLVQKAYSELYKALLM